VDLGGVGGGERVDLGCLISEKFSDKLSVNHEPIGDPNPGGFGVRKVMLDISEGVGDMGISIDKPVGGVPASKPRHKKKLSQNTTFHKRKLFFFPKNSLLCKKCMVIVITSDRRRRQWLL
jgi:hypothetical protein